MANEAVVEHTKLSVKVVGPRDGVAGFLGSIGVRFMIDGQEAGQRFALVEHPMSPRALAAPLHKHSREDEYSFVLEGRLGALLGDEVVIGKPGDLIFKPREQWHTFWNAGDGPARILAAGFEDFFRELVGLGGVTQAPPQLLANLCERYGLELQPDTAYRPSSSASGHAFRENRRTETAFCRVPQAVGARLEPCKRLRGLARTPRIRRALGKVPRAAGTSGTMPVCAWHRI